MSNDEEDGDTEESIVSLFDSACLSFGDLDAICFDSGSSVCFYELQEYSKHLSHQLLHRFRPSYVLVDCLGHVAAEATALLACMRINIEFVPVSCYDQHAGGRLTVVVQELLKSKPGGNVVAIVCCADDQDPMLGVLAQANVHQVLYVDKLGNLQERLNVQDSHLLPPAVVGSPMNRSDNLYVMFTSGTSSNKPKAVIGSHRSTLRRLQWFRDEFQPSPRIGRRTRLTFVDSIVELFGALLYPPHSKLVAVEDPRTLQSEGVRALIDLNCTQLTLLPSQLAPILQLSAAGDGNDLSSLRRVIVSGEPCPESLLDGFRAKLPRATLVNLYGQTETTGDVLCAVLTDMEHAVLNNTVAVGKPIAGNKVFSRGIDGELVVTGNLCNGYLNSDIEVDEFATGDVGFCEHGIWYVKGRFDEVSKVNGVLTASTEVESAFCKAYFPERSDKVAATIIDQQVYILSEIEVPLFSRQSMFESGLPWNLIPKQVFVHHQGTIPRQASGAGKIDRLKVKQYVQDLLNGSRDGAVPLQHGDWFESLLADVVKVPVSELSPSVSFVENGGDSASAVTFLYRLRSHNFLTRCDLTAVDILQCDTIARLKSWVLNGTDNAVLKRQRTEATAAVEFKPQTEPTRVSDGHVTVQFSACVDAPPLVYNGDIFAACQDGVVQRISYDGYVLACRHLVGWMIQGGLLIHEEDGAESLLIVSAHNRAKNGLAIALSLDLQDIKWQHRFDNNGAIRTTPLVHNGKLWINPGKTLRYISLPDGRLDEAVHHLPMSISSRLFLFDQKISCISSEYETGMMQLELDASFKILHAEVLGPVHKDPTLMDDGSLLLISDSCGSLHCLRRDESVTTIRISSKPLVSACIVGEYAIVGSYNSMIYCLKLENVSLVAIRKWEFNANASIYSAPAKLRNNTVVVCTTAGDLIQLDVSTGKMLWRTRIAAEIWSNAAENQESVAVGARDSRLHLLSLGSGTCSSS